MHLCDVCDAPSTLRCSGCSKVYYCSKECQSDVWASHIFHCNPKKPINTAYYLARAARQDCLPDDPQTCEDYGFNRAFTAQNRSKLLGLFQGLVTYHRVRPKTIHVWRLKGTLVEEIKKIFEAQPPEYRGSYYPWFLRNQWVLDRTLPPPSGDNDPVYQLMLRGWRYADGPPLSTTDEIKAAKATWPEHKQVCLDFCTLLLSDWHPAPEHDYWILFGFCVCQDEWHEKDVSILYRSLIQKCTFDELYIAYESSSLIALFDSKGLQSERKKIVHLEDVLTGGPQVFKSVWYLKQLIMAQDIAITPSVAVDYGFVNCKGDNEKLALKECYKRYFQRFVDGDPIKLHKAAVAGKILECIEGVVKLNKKDRKMMQRLMNNPYPLQQVF